MRVELVGIDTRGDRITAGPLSLVQRYASHSSVEDIHRLRWRGRPPA